MTAAAHAGGCATHVLGEGLEAGGVPRDELPVAEILRDEHVHDAEGERRVGAGPDDQHLVRLRGGLGPAHVDRDHVGAAATRGHQMRGGVRLAREIGAPQHDQLRVRPHVLLGIGLERTGEADAEPAEPPADHGGRPPLAAPEIGEAPKELRVDARAVVVGEEAVARPEPDRLAPDRPEPFRDAIERRVPRHLPERRVPAVARERGQQALRVSDDLARGVAAHAEEAAAVGIVRVARDLDEPPVLDGDQHPAEGRMAVHRAHGADGGHVRVPRATPAPSAPPSPPPRRGPRRASRHPCRRPGRGPDGRRRRRPTILAISCTRRPAGKRFIRSLETAATRLTLPSTALPRRMMPDGSRSRSVSTTARSPSGSSPSRRAARTGHTRHLLRGRHQIRRLARARPWSRAGRAASRAASDRRAASASRRRQLERRDLEQARGLAQRGLLAAHVARARARRRPPRCGARRTPPRPRRSP